MKRLMPWAIGLLAPCVLADATHSAALTQVDADTWHLDITVSTTAGDDWNASALSADVEFPWVGSAVIQSPLDNLFGAWTPPFPYDAAFVDTYVVAPSNVPTQFASLAASTYTGASASVAWFDPPATVAPAAFLAARVAFDWPAELEPLILGAADSSRVLTIELDSATQLGGGTLFHSEFYVTLIPEPGAGALFALAATAVCRGARRPARRRTG